MKCSKCGANFKKALELVNGDTVCPVCFRQLTPGEEDFRLDSDEWFVLSQTYYLSYLELAANQSEESAREKAQRESKMSDYLSRALDYCERAAADYHPEALVDMGYYYYKNYENYDVGGIGRFRIAYTYFRCIIDGRNLDNLYDVYSRFYTKSGDKNASEKAEKKTREIIVKAVYYLKDMYSCAPAEFAANRKGNIYSVANTNKMLSEELRDLGIDYKITEADTAYAGETAKVESIKATLKRCTEKASPHPPIFGFYEISRREYDEISEFIEAMPSSAKKGFSSLLVTESTGGGFDVIVFDNGGIDTVYRNSGRVFFCFYNRNCVSKSLKKDFGNAKRVDEGIGMVEEMFDLNSSGEDLMNLVRFSKAGQNGESCIFYVDDVCFVSGHVMKAMDKDSIGEGFLSFLDESYRQ